MRLLRGAILSVTSLSLAGELCPEVPPISKATMTDDQSHSAFLYYIHHLNTRWKCHLSAHRTQVRTSNSSLT